MSQKDIKTNVIIGAKAEGFSGVTDKLSSLGEQLSQLSEAAQEILKESTSTYQTYEDNMLAVKAVLTSTLTSSSEVESQYQKLQKAAQNWAASTVFSTSDVSAAILDATRAGWDYDKIMEGLPDVMNLAQASGMSLSEAMSYFVPVLNNTGTAFEDGSLMIDKWVMAANSAPTTVGEIGDAIQNMGAVSQMFASDNEMYTMLDLLAQGGVNGSEAGTALRNVISRLYAPTKEATSAMEGLGGSVDDLMDDGESLDAAEQALNAVGLSAYDADGNMRPLLDVFSDMSVLLSGKTEEETNAFLKTVFGTKQYANAYTILKQLQGGYTDLYSSIAGSEGTAEEQTEVMMSGLTGSLAILSSKWEELERKVGESLAPGIELLAGALGGIVDIFNGMDDAQIAALTGGLTALAGLAPTLLGVTGIESMIKTIGVEGTAIVGVAVALGAMVGYMVEMDKEYKEGMFGDVTLDTQSIMDILSTQSTVYSELNKLISGSEEELKKSAEDAQKDVTTLNETIFTAVIGGTILTDEQKTELMGLGTDIVNDVQNGIESAKISSTQFFSSIFGEDSEEVSLVGGYMDSLSAEAESIGKTLRSQMVAALADDEIDAEEQAAIQGTVARLTEIEAKVQNIMSEAAYNTLIRKAQDVSYESATDFLSELQTQQAAEIANVDDLYLQEWGYLKAAYDDAMENGGTYTYNGETYTASDWSKLDSEFQAKWDEARSSTNEKYADAQMAAIYQLMSANGNDFVGMDRTEIYDAMMGGNGYVSLMAGYIKDLISSNGGLEKSRQLVQEMLADGKTESAGYLNSLLDFYTEYTAANAAGTESGWDSFVQDDVRNSLQDQLSQANGQADGKTYMDGVNSALSQGVTVRVHFVAGTGSSQTAVNALSGGSNLFPQTFAEGGRATTASVFGEAGAEWAIPEEHSDRTAQLLNAARAASGFTWADLISRYGGLNAGSGKSVSINYSPTVNAADVTGVEELLRKDKKDLKRLIVETLDGIGVSGTAGAYV